MNVPSTLTSLVDMVEDAYRIPCHCDETTLVVHKHFVVACLALANVGFQEKERYEQMAAMGLSTWTEAEREAFYNEYEVRYSIMKMVDNPPASWPAPISNEPEPEPELPEDPEEPEDPEIPGIPGEDPEDDPDE